MREMKDSKQAWLGAIPADWTISTIGSLYSLRNEKVSDRDYPPLSVTMKGVVPQLETAAKTDAHDDRKLVKKGDFAINSRSDRRGSCGISDYDGSVSLINTILTPREEMNPRYYNWVFHTSQFADEFYRWGHGIVDDLWTTRWQEMKNISVAVPPLSEQEAIAESLENEVAQIDALIANQQAQIEKLKQYKQSLITEVVTKGLDPNASMKDSGVEWIGMICESFVPYRIKDILAKEPDAIRVGPFGSSLKGSDILESGDYWVYNQRIVLDNAFNTCNAFINKGKYDELTSFRVKAGDVLCTTRGSIGKIARVPDECKAGVIHPCIIRFRINDQLVNYKLLELIFNFSDVVIGQLRLASNATTIDVVYSESLRNVTIPLGAKEQQEELLKFLLPKCRQIDSLVEKKMEKIKSLIDYKKSLIYECITGKKEAE